MKIEGVMPDWAVKEVNRLNKTISIITENYMEAIETYGTKKMTESLMQSMKADPVIHMCQERIVEIYTHSAPTIIITAENKEDREILEELKALWK